MITQVQVIMWVFLMFEVGQVAGTGQGNIEAARGPLFIPSLQGTDKTPTVVGAR